MKATTKSKQVRLNIPLDKPLHSSAKAKSAMAGKTLKDWIIGLIQNAVHP